MTTLLEILKGPGVEFKWLDSTRAVFSLDDKEYGIFVEYLELTLSKSYDVCNISFGILKREKTFRNSEDIDTSLTGAGRAQTIFSTVASASVSNKTLVACDFICMVGADEHKERRGILYSVIANMIKKNDAKFDSRFILYANNTSGSLITIVAKSELSKEDVVTLAEKAGVGKITEIPKANQNEK